MSSEHTITPSRVPLTWRKLATASGVAACALAVAASAIAQDRPGTIEWSIQRVEGSKVQLTIESRWGAGNHSVWSDDRPISDLAGLSPAQLAGPTGPARFALVRDAGRLDCSGSAGNLAGRGNCTFSVDPRFTTYLRQRGIGAHTPHDAFTLTMSGVGRDLIDAMEEIGYTRPSAEQLADMGIHGVSAEFVRGLARSGYRLRSADDLVNFKVHGVDLGYIQGMAAIGPKLQHLSADELVDLRIHGVTPDYVRQIAAIGPSFTEISADDLVNLSIHGAQPDLVRAYAAFTRGALNPDEVVDMAIHGVSAEYLRQLAALGYRDLTAEEVVNLRIHGVTPDYVERLQRSGMAHMSADQLVRLRLAGFEPHGR